MDEILISNKRLDDANHKWEHYFWTNDVKLIPETVKWFKENGFIIKEINELPIHVYDPFFEELVTSYLEERIGSVSDLVRFLVLYENGGFYMDMDYFVREFDNEILYYFDSIHTREDYYSQTVFNTYGLLVAPYHQEVKVYLDLVRQSNIEKRLKHVHMTKCLHRSKEITFWDTGSYMISAAFVKSLGMNQTQDAMLGRIRGSDG